MPNNQMSCKKTNVSQLLEGSCTSTDAHNNVILFILYFTDNLFFIVLNKFTYTVCQGILKMSALYLHKYSLEQFLLCLL